MNSRYARYATDDINMAFRRAAAMGEAQDIAFMRNNLSRVQINGAGAGTKMTALHQACKSGNLAAASFLLGNGADPDLGDKGEKNAYGYAADSNNRQLQELMHLYRIGREAWQIAHRLYPEQPDDASKPAFDRLAKNLSETVNNDVLAIKQEFIKIANKYRPEDEEDKRPSAVLTDPLLESRFLPALNNFLSYFYSLASAYHILNTSKTENFKKAYCDAIAGAVFCSLVNQGCCIERFLILHQVTGNNHAFIVLNRKEGSNPADPDTWGPAACFVNWTGEVYPVSSRPNDSVLNLLKLFDIQVHSNRQPPVEGLIVDEAKNFALRKCTEWAERFNQLPETRLIKEGSPTTRQATDLRP